jgi:hypothetical protein
LLKFSKFVDIINHSTWLFLVLIIIKQIYNYAETKAGYIKELKQQEGFKLVV